MSSTFGQMQATIADNLARSDLTSAIQVAINRAVEHYRKIRWWFMEADNFGSPFVGVAFQEGYGTADGVPSDMENIEEMQVEYGGRKFQMDEITLDELHNRQPGNVFGIPRFYCRNENQILINPIPNSAQTYTFLINYIKNYPTLVEPSDTNDFLTDAEDLIESRAEWWVNKRKIKDIDAAASNKDDENDAFNALMQRNDHNREGRVIPTNF